ncbi:3-phosphoshikimate 1-carboxyvinyltransferase [Mechercharimyces sp. CAU 1602]|uniref:3-phosphoshikimate 1-carboxyvinyltransferase n=1 Tax=Mechercharimyces sp. CAU 1602 TaxID=2973933 RepID=UPI0037C78809
MKMNPPRRLQGQVQVPGDKSISHRAVMFGAVANGTTRVNGFLAGADCRQTVACFRQLGVEIQAESDTSLRVIGKGWEGLREPQTVLDVGNSGTTIRLLLGILAGRPFHATIIGDESIARRPMGRVVHPLSRMGAQLDGRENGKYTPLSIRGGNLSALTYESPIASAQVKSALLLAGLQAEGVTHLTEPTRSRDHSERMLASFGVDIEVTAEGVSVQGGQSLSATNVKVPGDISSAAFLIGAALLVPDSEITIRDVGLNPTRTGIITAVRAMGADMNVNQTDICCGEPIGDITIRTSSLRGIHIGGELIPRLIDEIPLLALLATQAEGRTVIADAAELRVKETDRIYSTAQELRKLGARVEETEDGLVIDGPTPLIGNECNSYGDHRIGMMAAIAGLIAEGGVEVKNAGAIQVSFPGFVECVQHLCVE